MFVGELDEDILEAGRQRANFGNGDFLLLKEGAQGFEVELVVNQRMDRLSKNRGAADAGERAGDAQGPRDFRSRNFDAEGSLRLNFGKFAQGIWSSVGDELAVIDVGDVAAA